MAAPAVQFGQLLYSSLVQAGAIGPAVPAIISPLSVWFALLLLLNGAGVPSTTYSELYKAISGSSPASSRDDTAGLAVINSRAAGLQGMLSSQSSDINKLIIANALWTKDISLKQPYTSQMKSLFGAEVSSVKDVTPINSWAAKVTNSLIQQVMAPGADFNMVITNAVYFKGLWEYPFDKMRTKQQPFRALAKGGSIKLVQVQMMSRLMEPSAVSAGAQRVAYTQAIGKYRAVRLPYKGSSGLAAVLVLPDVVAYKDVFAAAADITAPMMVDGSRWARLSDSLSLSVPRFKVKVSQLSMKQALQSMGIKAAFDQKQADFGKASAAELYATDVLQSAFVQVDESGTEAAAVTAIPMVLKSAAIPQQQQSLVFDRPFLFYLVELTTQSVLFQGVVTDPSST